MPPMKKQDSSPAALRAAIAALEAANTKLLADISEQTQLPDLVAAAVLAHEQARWRVRVRHHPRLTFNDQLRIPARCPLPVYLRVAGSVGREVQAAIRRGQRPRGAGHRQQPLDLRAVGRGQHPHA